MAAIEDIVAWCRAERSRLTHQLEELQSGRLRTYEKQAQPPGWLEIDTTGQSIDLCRQNISELNAIVARYPEVVAASARQPAAIQGEHHLQHVGVVHAGWLHGWGVVKGTQPNWNCKGAYATRTGAEEEAAKAGKGYYVRWGSYNERTKEFTSGPSFSTV
jgi:hypothetical protein